MKKWLILVTFCLALVLAIVACTDDPASQPGETTGGLITTQEPTEEPTTVPTEEPSAASTEEPAVTSTEEPAVTSTEEPTTTPNEKPTEEITEKPTEEITEKPTEEITEGPTTYSVKFVTHDGTEISSATLEPGATVPAPTAHWVGNVNQTNTCWKDDEGNLYYWNNHSKYDDKNVVTGWVNAAGDAVDLKVTGNMTLTAWSFVVDLSTISGVGYRGDGTPQLGGMQSTAFDLGAWDLSRFSAVKVTYGFDPLGNERIDGKSVFLLASSDQNGVPVASIAMAAVFGMRADGPATVTLDLSSADQSYTNLYLASNNADSTGCYRIEFLFSTGSDAPVEPDTDPVEPDTDPVEPETDPVKPEYNENWSVDFSEIEGATQRGEADGYAWQIKMADPNVIYLDLGTVDLSKYSAVKILYGGDIELNNQYANNNALFYLTSTQDSVGSYNAGVTKGEHIIATAPIEAINPKGWYASRQYQTISLSGVNYNGQVYLTIPTRNPAMAVAFMLFGIEFIGDPDNQPIESNMKVSGAFGSHMVLQRDMPIEIWGFSDAKGSTITGSFAGETATTQVTDGGTWKLTFSAQTYNKVGQTMTISDDLGVQVILEDILIGDVWFVGGQSNAELRVSSCVNHSTLDIDASDAIRLFMQSQGDAVSAPKYTLTPQRDVVNPDRCWKISDQSAVYGFSAIGYFFAKEVYEQTGIPQGVVMIAAGGATLSELMSAEAARSQGLNNGVNVALAGYYNALIHPFVGMNCKGMLFFQGESEGGTRGWAEKYDQYMTALIQDERERWGQDFPLYYVQLCDYRYRGPQAFPFHDIVRVKQFDALKKIPNSTMIVSWDWGSPEGYPDKTHSPLKQAVGLRLAYAALAKEYGIGKESQVSSPIPVKAVLSEDKTQITITFRNVADGLVVLGMTPEDSIGQTVIGFSLGGYPNRIPATATITSSNTVVVDIPDGVDPTCVNYAYSLNITTDTANLFASNDFPAPSFSLPVPTVPDSDEDMTDEPDTDPKPVPTSYTINWVVDGKIVASGTATDAMDVSSKPATDPSKKADVFTYAFVGWSQADINGATVTYTAKFNAKLNLTEALPMGPASGFTPVLLGKADLSQYSKVEMIVTFNSAQYNDGRYNGKPIALVSSAAGTVRDIHLNSVQGMIAYTELSDENYLDRKNFDGTDGTINRHKLTLDLFYLTYNGDVYIAAYGGPFNLLHELIFYADADGSWVEPSIPEPEPETPPSSYTVNWVVDGETVATATATDPADQSSKPTTHPTKAADAFTYVFAGWSDAVIEGATVTYTAKFNAKLNLTAALPTGPAAGFTPVLLGKVDLSQYSKAELIVTFNGEQYNSGSYNGKPVALVSSDAGNLRTHDVSTIPGMLAYTVISAENYLDQKNFDGTDGTINRHKLTIDLSSVTYSGDIYIATYGGPFNILHELVLYAEDDSWVEPDFYTVKWVAGDKTIATATATDPADQSSKPDITSDVVTDTFTYSSFLGWSEAVVDGKTITYTAKFDVVKMNFTSAFSTASTQFVPNKIANMDLSQYSKVEIIVQFSLPSQNGSGSYGKPVALVSGTSGVVRDKTDLDAVSGMLSYALISADTYLDQKNFDGTTGNMDRHKLTIDLSSVDYSGDVYIATHGGTMWTAHEIIFYA